MSAGAVFALRASQAANWVRCTAYPLMNAGASEIAADVTVREEGTAFHWAALMVWLGYTLNVGTRTPNGIEIDDDMLDAIDEYLPHIRSLGGEPRLEYTVAAPRIHPQCGGTTDAWTWHRTPADSIVLDVIDAKYGYRWVDPFENWQCLVYVSGLLDLLNAVDDTRVTVRIWIFQPRAYRRGGPWFKWEVRASDLRAYFNTLRNAAEATMSERAKCVSGPWCTDCNARLACDTFDAAVENALEVVGEPINNDVTAQRADTELVRVSRALEILDARRTALSARAEMFVRQGVQLRHHELQPGRSRARWKEGMQPALESIEQKEHVVLFHRKPITPTQALKVIDPKLVDALSERPAAGMKLVRVDEKRAARIFGQTSES